MSTEIYYFSGTGNSLVVARDIAKQLDGKIIPIHSLMDKKSITTDADVIGIVFPVYNAVFDGIPHIIQRFAKKLDNLDSKYIFAVCTCKGWSRVTITKFGELIKKQGGILSAGFTVPMPDNSSPTSIEKQQKLFNNWKKKLKMICCYVNARKKGKFENTILFNLIMAPFMSIGRKSTLKLYSKLADSSSLSLEKLIPLSDKSFIADKKCNGCGTCAKVCPTNNIKIVNGKPLWQHHCESCLACINFCPQKAIHGGISSTEKIPTRYHHPDINVDDIAK